MDPLGISVIVERKPTQESRSHSRATSTVNTAAAADKAQVPPTPAKDFTYTPSSAQNTTSGSPSVWSSPPNSGRTSTFTAGNPASLPSAVSSSPWAASSPASPPPQSAGLTYNAFGSSSSGSGMTSPSRQPRSPFAQNYSQRQSQSMYEESTSPLPSASTVYTSSSLNDPMISSTPSVDSSSHARMQRQYQSDYSSFGQPPLSSTASTFSQQSSNGPPSSSTSAHIRAPIQDQANLPPSSSVNEQQAQRARQELPPGADIQARLEALREKDNREGYVRIRVHGIERNKKDLWVKLEAQTNLSTYHAAHIKPFSRSYGEFIALHLALASNHPEIIVPALPITETASATTEEEERLLKLAFQRWCERLVKNFDLCRDEELRSFLEAHFGYTPVTIRRRLKPSSSFAKLPLRSSRASQDPDDDLSTTKNDMTQLETQFSEVARAIDKVGRNRKMLAGALFELSEQLSAFSTTEAHKPLAFGFKKMSEGTRRLGDMDSGLATAECVTLADALAYESVEAKEAKDALVQRQLIVEEHRNASKNAINKKRQIEKLKLSNNIKPERADEALEEFEDAKKHEVVLKSKLDAVSDKLAPSLINHVKEMNADMFQAMLLHGRTGLAFERQALKDLDTLRNDIRNIPTKGSQEVYYVHQPAASTSAPTSAAATLDSSIRFPSSLHSPSASISSDLLSPPLGSADLQRQSPHFRDGTQSMIVPPTHTSSPLARSPSNNSRIGDLAKSVYLPGGASETVKGRERITDDRQRVDSAMAARKLANMRF